MRAFVWVAVALIAGGCGKQTAPPAGTGAREAAQAYYDALARQDWPAAHATLHPESQAKLTPEEFGRRASRHYARLGFEPQSAHVRACEERGEEATAHVTLSGRGQSGPGRFRDAVALRRGEGGWGVMLPANFGR